MQKRNIIDSQLFQIMVQRLCQQLIENHNDFSDSVILGLQPRGSFFAQRVQKELKALIGIEVPLGKLDISFYRDDYRRRQVTAGSFEMSVPFIIEDKKVILVDDVLFTGRTVRAAMEAMIAFGRPCQVELMVLIDRKYSRELPIYADYVGRYVTSLPTENVLVELKEQGAKDDNVWLSKKK